MKNHYELTGKIMQACIEVHKHMGPGLLEKVYETCLMREFHLRGIKAQAQVALPLTYKGIELDKSYSIDILVEDEIILELKATENILPVFEAQLISYLRLSEKKVGYLINFNVPLMKQGIKRYVSNFSEISAPSAPLRQTLTNDDPSQQR